MYLSLSPLLFASFISSAICKASSDAISTSCFYFLGVWFSSMPPVQYYGLLSTVLWAHYLLDLVSWIYLSPLLYGIWFKPYLAGLVFFLVFFSLSLNFAMRSLWSESQSAPSLLFWWLYIASPSLATKNVINLISVLTIWWCPCVKPSLVLLKKGVCYE